jgi:hypothetical protein
LLLTGILLQASTGAEPVSYFNEPVDEPLKIRVTREPQFPLELKLNGVTRGQAVFMLSVNEKDELEDYLMIAATHRQFGREVARVIEDWDFSAPRTGVEKIPVIQSVEINFEASGTVLSLDVNSVTRLFLFDKLKHPDAFRTYKLSELDDIPEPIQVEEPYIPKDLVDENKRVHAVFSFYIDPEGNVRMPLLQYVDDEVDPLILLITEQSLHGWKFTPPTYRGDPVLVRVAQPFQYQFKVDRPDGVSG